MSTASEGSSLANYAVAIAIGLAVAAVAGCDTFYDDHTSPLERAQRRQAAIEQCRAQYGFNARILQTREGHLVCRRGGPAT